MKTPHLDGDDYFDKPEDEHGIGKFKPDDPIITETHQHIYPCYVYDKDGKLLRVEYPKVKKWKKWTSRY